MNEVQIDAAIANLIGEECKLRVAGSHIKAGLVEQERRDLWFKRTQLRDAKAAAPQLSPFIFKPTGQVQFRCFSCQCTVMPSHQPTSSECWDAAEDRAYSMAD